MEIVKSILNSFVFWGAWIIIPVIMEIVPSIGTIGLLLKRRIKSKETYKKPTIYPEITIIVPVYNSEKTLFSCIQSIYNSTYPNESIRVFLVNNRSRDNSFSAYAKCQEEFQDLRMQWMNSEQGKSRALDLALYNSEGKYIINLDSDGVLEPSALINMIDKFEAFPDLNCMTGAILTRPAKIKEYKGFFAKLLRNLEFMEYAQAFLAGRSYASEINAVYTLSGAFSAFRKSVLLKSWMYNTDTVCEDTHITFQMRYLQKERVEVCENAIFFVEPIEDGNRLYTQRQRWQRGSLEVAQMFMNKDFKLRNIFSDINVKTLVYDHTFAFPRLIWYLALICLLCMNYSAKVVLYSTGLIFALYIAIGFFYFFAVKNLLKMSPETKKYYTGHWWCIFFLPLFNLMIFFIRIAGIINSIHTNSAWKTRNLTEEREAFVDVIKADAQKPIGGLKKVSSAVNISEEDIKKKNEKQKKRRLISSPVIAYICVGSLYFFPLALAFAGWWQKKTYGVGLNELLNTLKDPIHGTGADMMQTIIRGCVLPIAGGLIGLLILCIIDCQVSKRAKGRWIKWVHKIAACGSIVALVASTLFLNGEYDLLGYYQSRSAQTHIYENYYVNPHSVSITGVEGQKTKNLIYIYVESLETTYASTEDGGFQEINYMPKMTQLAKENISFSDSEDAGKLGGFHSGTGMNWTLAALFSTTTGVPYAMPISDIDMGKQEEYMPGVVTLGEILEEKGYEQEFICGSDGTFAGRKKFFEQHGGYEVLDVYAAKDKNYIPDDYNHGWGFEDYVLFDIAKDEVKKLAAGDKPFNLTLLTVDLHTPDGYICDRCGDKYDSVTANVLECNDREITDFINWCREQDFYEDTVIVITGDHPRMDNSLVDGVDYYEREVYNCFINSAKESEKDIHERTAVTLDMFPTVLSAMGFEIEGDRLGLGTDLFSDRKTLTEEKGFEWLEQELSKSSDYYISTFAPNIA